MQHDKELKSIKVDAGRRTYFIDVKQTINAARYLKITESKHLENGAFERHQMMIFEEDINKLNQALQDAFFEFPNFKKPVPLSRMAELKEKFSNAYRPWTEEDDAELTRLYCEGKKPKELSIIFKRNQGGIKSRIEKLELENKYGKF